MPEALGNWSEVKDAYRFFDNEKVKVSSIYEAHRMDSMERIKEINSMYLPYDYCYTAVVPGDIHVEKSRLPGEIKAVLNDFRNHRADLQFEDENHHGKDSVENSSVLDRIREAEKAPKKPRKDKSVKNKKETDH